MKGKKKTEGKKATACGKGFQYCDSCELLKLDDDGKWSCSEGHETYRFEEYEKKVETW